MREVKPIRVRPGISVRELVEEMERSGVLGAGRVAKAARIVAEMFSDRKYTVFLSVAGPLVPAGLRGVVSDLVGRELVHALVTTGANITHDIMLSFGMPILIGSHKADDRKLLERGLSRIYDMYVRRSDIEEFERRIWALLDEIPEEERDGTSIYGLMWEIGARLPDESSILRRAWEKRAPVFSPGLLDSVLGMQLWMYSRLRRLVINPLLDFEKFSELVYEARKAGAIILGGGTPKHHVLYMNTLRGGLDAAVQITTATPEDGSLSGAPLEEAVSWGKVKTDKFVTVHGDATIVFPLVVAAALELMEG